MLSGVSAADARAGHGALGFPRLDAAGFCVFAIAFGVMLGLGKRLLADPDSFLHVAAGRWIGAHGAGPALDPFSATRGGAPWEAHEWLAELMMAGAFGASGWAGVVALTAMALALAFAVLAAALGRRLAPAGVALLLAASFLLLAPHVSARPHILALPAMAAWVAGLVRAREDERAPSLWLLVPLALWANLHGSFVVALGLALAFALEAVRAAQGKSARRAAGIAWGAFIAAAAAASLATPFGIAGWLFPFRLAQMSYALSLVGEWKPASFAHFQPLEVWLLGLVALGFAAPVRLQKLRLVLLMGMIHLALAHARYGDVLAVVGPLLLAEPLAAVFGPAAARSLSPRAAALALALVAAVTAADLAMVRIANDDPRIAPARALAHAGPGLVFNDYDFGDFLIFAGAAPFVDGRLDLYGDNFMRNYMAALDGDGAVLGRLLKHYRVRWTILKPGRGAVAVLDRLPGWRRVYGDADAVVHVNARP
jgi:hypothetical protein